MASRETWSAELRRQLLLHTTDAGSLTHRISEGRFKRIVCGTGGVNKVTGNSRAGRAIAEAVSRWLPTAAARV
jgi:hypothetical protein